MSEPEVMDALHALERRGVNAPEALLEYGTPTEIIRACHHWDQQSGVNPGLLVSWIRNQNFGPEPRHEETPLERLQAQFEEYATRFPVGTPIHSPHYRSVRVENPPPHAKIWDRIRQEDCPGTVKVVAADFPTLTAECDQCRYDCATPVGQLHTLEAPAND